MRARRRFAMAATRRGGELQVAGEECGAMQRMAAETFCAAASGSGPARARSGSEMGQGALDAEGNGSSEPSEEA